MTFEVTNGIKFTVTVVQPPTSISYINVTELDDRVTLVSGDNVDVDAVAFTEVQSPDSFLTTKNPIPENELVILHPDLDENNRALTLEYLAAQARYFENARLHRTKVVLVRPPAKSLDEMTVSDAARFVPFQGYRESNLFDIVGLSGLPAFISGLLPGVKEPDTIPFPDQEHRSTT